MGEKSDRQCCTRQQETNWSGNQLSVSGGWLELVLCALSVSLPRVFPRLRGRGQRAVTQHSQWHRNTTTERTSSFGGPDDVTAWAGVVRRETW